MLNIWDSMNVSLRNKITALRFKVLYTYSLLLSCYEFGPVYPGPFIPFAHTVPTLRFSRY